MTDVVRRLEYLPTPVTSRANRVANKAVQLAFIRAVTGVADELADGEIVATRHRVAAALTREVVNEVADLHHHITSEAHGDPALEMTLREFELVLVRGTRRSLEHYVNRPL